MNASTIKRGVGLVCLAAITTLISLGLAEVAIRVFDLGPHITAVHHGNLRLSADPLLRYELAPGATNDDLVVNSFGMRDREFPLAKAGNVFRIACIGDSVTYGFSIPAADSYPKRLEALLNTYCASSPAQFEVLNFGVPGYNLQEIVQTLKTKVLPFQPDLVIYGYCLNDPQDLNLEFIRLLEELTEAKRRYVNPPQTEAFLIVHSRLFRLAVFALRRTLKPWQERGRHMFATDDPETLALKKSTHAGYFTDLHTQGASHATLVQGLDAIAAACAAENIPVCVFIFPVTNGLDPYPLTGVHQLLADLCRQHGWRAHDLLDSYRTYQRKRGANQYFDYLHPTADASRFTAMAMLAFLLKDAALPTVAPAEAARRLQAGPAEDRTFALWAQFPEMPDGSRAGTTP